MNMGTKMSDKELWDLVEYYRTHMYDTSHIWGREVFHKIIPFLYEKASADSRWVDCRVYHAAPGFQEYLNARFGANKSANLSFEWQGHRWMYRHTDFDDDGDFDLLQRHITPQITAGRAVSQHQEQSGESPAQSVPAVSLPPYLKDYNESCPFCDGEVVRDIWAFIWHKDTTRKDCPLAQCKVPLEMWNRRRVPKQSLPTITTARLRAIATEAFEKQGWEIDVCMSALRKLCKDLKVTVEGE